jgi:hypothetical protein
MAENTFYKRFDQMFGERDGRLRDKKGEVFGTAGPFHSQLWEPCFCYCGAPGGYVSKGTPIVYVCQKCTATYGTLPLPMVPGTEED